MAIFYLIRHGQPDYTPIDKRGFPAFGRDLAPLSEEGKRQAAETAKDIRLKQAEIIVSSPYTRALQTAAAISREIGLDIQVEVDLHEWLPDLTYCYNSTEESMQLAQEFTKYRGIYPAGKQLRWETLEHMRQRMQQVADRYAEYRKVILVGHGMSLRTLAYIEEMKPGEIVECHYEKGQVACEYSFY